MVYLSLSTSAISCYTTCTLAGKREDNSIISTFFRICYFCGLWMYEPRYIGRRIDFAVAAMMKKRLFVICATNSLLVSGWIFQSGSYF
jgi:hypothetical protein